MPNKHFHAGFDRCLDECGLVLNSLVSRSVDDYVGTFEGLHECGVVVIG
jgi:hypothetical protein